MSYFQTSHHMGEAGSRATTRHANSQAAEALPQLSSRNAEMVWHLIGQPSTTELLGVPSPLCVLSPAQCTHREGTHRASPGTVNKGTRAKQALQVQQVWPWVTSQPPAPRQAGRAVSQTITWPFINSARPSLKLTFPLTD